VPETLMVWVLLNPRRSMNAKNEAKAMVVFIIKF